MKRMNVTNNVLPLEGETTVKHFDLGRKLWELVKQAAVHHQLNDITCNYHITKIKCTGHGITHLKFKFKSCNTDEVLNDDECFKFLCTQL